ncbi:multidrug efflux SMR transporter [Streptomyces sp. TRM49041]|uniref:DMT family transporter n=1 Tax=Streptomyces sp. TRM49041 TaxID=2603216 RepID=UPI0011F00EF3|nr:multidrug efflux SMR transporter [Streptomyces sp. TRM49041]
MVWLLLAGAITAEVSATLALRWAEGFSRVGPSLLVVAGYALSFYLLSKVLGRGLPLGVAYGIWSGVGVTLVAVLGAVLFEDRLTWAQVGGIGLVAAGVFVLETGASH